MNAVIVLCHFCEAHGPSSILCTQTLRETKIEDINFDEMQTSNKLCPACNSIGTNGILSRDEKNNSFYLSTQTPIFPDVSNLIKQASVRSLSCEISSKKDGGFVFFGDTLNGHILSHTFHVSDLQARGFYQLFSIIIVMKDKYYLLNIKPFLAKFMTKISSKIQELAKRTRNEEKARSSPIGRRIAGGSQIIPTTPRSLINLTEEKNIFHFIHINFTWLLLAGSKCLAERISFGNLPRLICRTESGNSVNCSLCYKGLASSRNTLNIFNECKDEEFCEQFSLRRIKVMLGNNFTKVCYCILTGINVLIRGPPEKIKIFVEGFKILLPANMHKLIQIDCTTLDTQNYKILTVQSEVAVPIPCLSIFRIDYIEMQSDKVNVKWLGQMPNKLPNLLLQIIKAMNEILFTNFVLAKRLTVLVEEWKNKVMHLSKIKSSTDLAKLKKILGVLSQDQPLINYWGQYLR